MQRFLLELGQRMDQRRTAALWIVQELFRQGIHFVSHRASDSADCSSVQCLCPPPEPWQCPAAPVAPAPAAVECPDIKELVLAWPGPIVAGAISVAVVIFWIVCRADATRRSTTGDDAGYAGPPRRGRGRLEHPRTW